MITAWGQRLQEMGRRVAHAVSATVCPVAPPVTVTPKFVITAQTPVNVATTPALSAPGVVVKRKLEDMSAEQFRVLLAALAASSHPDARALGARLAQGDRNFVAPHFVRHRDADGVKRAYVVNRTCAKGAYGKFRHVLELREGAKPRHLAAKEFRDKSRFFEDMHKIQERVLDAELSQSDVWQILYNSQKVAELARNGKIDEDQAAAIEIDPTTVDTLVRDGVITASQGRAILLNDNHLRAMVREERLDAHKRRNMLLTQFVDPEAVHREYALAAQAGSPLTAQDTVSIGGRILVITRVMDGHLGRAAGLNPAIAGTFVRHVLARVATHMAVAHAKGVVHRDIKPDNLFFDVDALDVIPGDFGLAIDAGDDEVEGYCGTPGFTAPEMLQKQPYGKPSDVFSLGITAAAIAMGCCIAASCKERKGSVMVLGRVRETCPKNADGTCDLSRVEEVDGVLPCSREELRIRSKLADWYKRDPELATYVFSKMLAVDPAERDTMAQVAARFAPQPTVARGVLSALAGRDTVAGELAIMQAFGKAYQAGWSPRGETEPGEVDGARRDIEAARRWA